MHSIAVSLFANKDQIHFFDEIGYEHNPYIHCPRGEGSWARGKCDCEPKRNFGAFPSPTPLPLPMLTAHHRLRRLLLHETVGPDPSLITFVFALSAAADPHDHHTARKIDSALPVLLLHYPCHSHIQCSHLRTSMYTYIRTDARPTSRAGLMCS